MSDNSHMTEQTTPPEVESAFAYCELGMFADALEELKRVPPFLRKSKVVLDASAHVYREAGDRQRSYLMLNLLQRRDPSASNRYAMSLCLFHLRRYDEAREILMPAMPELNSWENAWWNLACIEVGRGRLKVAQHAARMAVQCSPEVLDRLLDDPDLKPIHLYLETLQPSGQSLEAVDSNVWEESRLPAFAPVCAVSHWEYPDEDWGNCMAFPTKYQAFLDRARAYADLEMFQDAEAELNRVPFHFRSSVAFIRHLAYVLSFAKRWSEVIPLYQQLCQCAPHAFGPRYNLAHSLSAVGLFKNALAVLDAIPFDARHSAEVQAKKEEIQDRRRKK
jgi:tetratricopeptide (TPR) repeat protein